MRAPVTPWRVAALQIADCPSGHFVEIESGQERPWYGQIVATRDDILPLAVRWLSMAPAKVLPDCLSTAAIYVFRGGAHYVGLESVRQARAAPSTK